MSCCMPRFGAVGTALVSAALLVTACSSGEGGPPKVAAVVQGVEIASAETEDLVEVYLDRQKAQGQQSDPPRAKIAKLVLEYQIKLTFLEHLARKLGATSEPEEYFTAAAEVLQPETYQAVGLRPEDFARELKVLRLSKAIAETLYPDISVSEDAVRQEYDRVAHGLKRNWKATVSVARFRTEHAARQLRELRAGERLVEAAKALGAQRTGTVEVNPLTASLPVPVLDVIENAPVGEVTEPLRIGDGWVAVLVEGRQDLPELSLEDVRAEVTDIVVKRQRALLFREWFDKQFTTADVDVNEHYGEWDSKFTSVT